MPCRGCQPGNSSFCTSCYTSLAGVTQRFLDVSANTCVQNCQTTQYTSLVAGDFKCYPCAPTCLTCANTSTNCTACAASTYLYLPLSQCLSECPPEFYESASPNICIDCASPCLYCSGPAGLTCSLCENTHVLTLYPNSTTTCTLSCPTGYFNNSLVCALCPGNCATCAAIQQCTGCRPGFYLYNGSCLGQCPNSLYISIASGNTTC